MQRMDAVVTESVSPVRLLGLLLLIGSVMAAVFAATGIYGVLTHWVAARWREFGVRFALGASPADVTRLVFRQVIGFTAIGIGVGLPCGLAVLRLLRTSLFGLAAVDALTASGVAAFIVAMAAGAALAPARRARQADPAVLLQSE
jgi:putative ABC transport system permease protein